MEEKCCSEDLGFASKFICKPDIVLRSLERERLRTCVTRWFTPRADSESSLLQFSGAACGRCPQGASAGTNKRCRVICGNFNCWLHLRRFSSSPGQSAAAVFSKIPS